MLAILAIALAATVASAHAARMSVAPDHAAHAGGMMQASAGCALPCNVEQPCESADSAMCVFVCAGLSAFLTAPDAGAGRGYEPVSLGPPPEATHAGRAPALNERPPKSRLL
ncbi:hypothetical protein [Pikeienuella sp. HZG-20]|uniref:hypothetical protein n=1 Tax=Paludibacillus litoralis TaxID=3133267 RepID=UPI0030EF0B48